MCEGHRSCEGAKIGRKAADRLEVRGAASSGRAILPEKSGVPDREHSVAVGSRLEKP